MVKRSEIILAGIFIHPSDDEPRIFDDSKNATGDFYEYLIPRLYGVVSQESADIFDVLYMDGSGTCIFKHFTAEEFPAVYKLSMQACDELENMKPYKEALKAALEADPRFQAA